MWEEFPYFVEIKETIITILKTGFYYLKNNYLFRKFFAQNTLSLQSNN